MALEIRSNLDPKQVHEGLLKTYQKWIEFAMGTRKIGGKMLKHPSGRMAASLKAEYSKEGNVVAIYVDTKELGAMENVFIQGHKQFSIKRRMLQPGRPGVKRSKAGYLYRYIPIRNNPIHPRRAYALSAIKNLLTTKDTPQGGIIHINRNLARMWASNYSKASYTSGKIRTMSNKPGSARWIIPAMPTFSLSKLLTEALPKNLKGRVIFP